MTREGVLLLLNGELENLLAIKKLARRAQIVVCADGGCRHAVRLGLTPRFIVGDMDSLPLKRPRWHKARYICDFDENASDFEKSLRFCLRIGVKKIFVAGASGGRLDHAMINQRVAENYAGKLDIAFAGSQTACLAGPGRRELKAKRGDKISLLAVPPGARVSLKGGRYLLKKEFLKPGSRGLSNEATGNIGLTVHSGSVWIISPSRRSPGR